MQPEKKSFLIYFDNCTWLDTLDYEQQGRLFAALHRYAAQITRELITPMEFLNQGTVEMAGKTMLVFGFMADTIYRDTVKWRASVQKRLQRKAEERKTP